MGKKLAIKGHVSRGKEVIELLKMMGGENFNNYDGKMESLYFLIDIDNIIKYGSNFNDNFLVYFTLEEFLEKYPFKVGDKIFLYDNITEGRVTGMEWDENKETVKYCVYTSAEYWCDVEELLKWNAEFLVNKEKGEEVDKMFLSHLHRNHLEIVLSELYEHIKTTPKEELEREFEEIKEWSNVGPTVEEFMTFCECVNKKPKYPTTYAECKEMLPENVYYGYSRFMTLQKLIICRDVYWKIYGEQMGLGEPWEPKFGKIILFSIKFYLYQDSFILHKGEYSSSDNCILVFPTEEMRDVFYENFKDLIEQCKELL